ncbi:MAG: CSLREA domain-containing protein [Acidobacteria bacterium]|nr:CSLREA domain-containing protein [Acidobacteriota bacterium]
MRKLLFCLTAPVFVLTLAAFAEGATLTVTKTADTNDGVCDADCRLREAVAAAASGDTIQFASPLFDTAQTISINGQITIDKSLTMTGRGASLTTIKNVAAAGPTSRVLLVTTGTTVDLSGLTITGGNLTAGVAVNGGFDADRHVRQLRVRRHRSRLDGRLETLHLRAAGRQRVGERQEPRLRGAVSQPDRVSALDVFY